MVQITTVRQIAHHRYEFLPGVVENHFPVSPIPAGPLLVWKASAPL